MTKTTDPTEQPLDLAAVLTGIKPDVTGPAYRRLWAILTSAAGTANAPKLRASGRVDPFTVTDDAPPVDDPAAAWQRAVRAALAGLDAQAPLADDLTGWYDFADERARFLERSPVDLGDAWQQRVVASGPRGRDFDQALDELAALDQIPRFGGLSMERGDAAWFVLTGADDLMARNPALSLDQAVTAVLHHQAGAATVHERGRLVRDVRSVLGGGCPANTTRQQAWQRSHLLVEYFGDLLAAEHETLARLCPRAVSRSQPIPV